MSRSKPPTGTGGPKRPPRSRRKRPDLAAAIQAAAFVPAAIAAPSDPPPPVATQVPGEPGSEAARQRRRPGPDPGPNPTLSGDPDITALSLSMLDFYREAAEAQFAFWSRLLGRDPAVPPRRDDEAA